MPQAAGTGVGSLSEAVQLSVSECGDPTLWQFHCCGPWPA
jgi:hypothetical protein